MNGRAEAPDARRGRTLSSSARGAQPPAHHGPFQRWLEDALIQPTVRARFPQRNPARGLNGTSALTAAASATNAAEAQEITQDLADGPRALPQSQTKGPCLGSSRLSLSLHRRVWLRPLTVKLRGRTTTLDERRGRTLSPGARGAKQTTPHGPLQRLLGARTTRQGPHVLLKLRQCLSKSPWELATGDGKRV